MVPLHAGVAGGWASPDTASEHRPSRPESIHSGVIVLPTALEGPVIFPGQPSRERYPPSACAPSGGVATRALPAERVILDHRSCPPHAEMERVAIEPGLPAHLGPALAQAAPDPWTSGRELEQQQAQIDEVNRKFIRAMELINGVSESTDAQLCSLQARFELRLQELLAAPSADGALRGSLSPSAPDAAQAEQQRDGELVKVAAALCSDVRALQDQAGRSGGELERLQLGQSSLSGEVQEVRQLQVRQHAGAEAALGQVAQQVREVQAEFAVEMRQLTSHIEALQGMCKTNAEDVEALREELHSREREPSPGLGGPLGVADAPSGRSLESLREELGARSGQVESLQARHGEEIQALRQEHAGLLQGLQDLVRAELEAAQQQRLPEEEEPATVSALEGLRGELRSGLEALRGQLRACPPPGALDALRQRLQGELEAVHARLRGDIEDLQAQSQQAGRWGLLDALQGPFGCQHGGAAGATARGAHQRDVESLRSEAREQAAELQALRRQQREELDALRGEQARLLEGAQGQLGASLQAVQRRLEGDLEAVQGRQGESAQGLQALQGQQSTCSAGLQALRNQHTRLITVQEQLIDDVGAIKSQLVDNVKMLQGQSSSQGCLLEVLQSNYNKQSGDIEALRSEHKALASRQSQDFEELKAVDVRLNGQIEELRSKQSALIPPVCQV